MPTSVERTVLLRVKTIHALRPLMRHGILAVLVLTLSLAGIGREVWVAKVIENMPSLLDVGASVQFFAAAVMGTEPLVQLLCVLMAVSSVLFLHAFARAVGGMYTLKTT